jgi:quercetin dioxygenase-like cupin family protein
MSNQNRIHHVPAGSGPVYWGPGDQVRFILTGAQTGGAFFLAEVLVPPGGGPPPHIHEREDETFYLLQGTLTVQVGDQTVYASQGDCSHLPRGIVHSFRNTGKEHARMLVTATPAGIEKYFEEAFYPAVEGKDPPPVTPELLERLMAASARHGQTVLPPAHS